MTNLAGASATSRAVTFSSPAANRSSVTVHTGGSAHSQTRPPATGPPVAAGTAGGWLHPVMTAASVTSTASPRRSVPLVIRCGRSWRRIIAGSLLANARLDRDLEGSGRLRPGLFR
jgi:hypothetical protein